MKENKFEFKPYLKERMILPVAEGDYTNQPARLEHFKSWRAENKNGEPAKVFETWNCSISMPEETHEFNLSKDKEFEVPLDLLEARRVFLAAAPERFSNCCNEAQNFADKQNEPEGVWECEEGMFHSRQVRFIEPQIEILAVLYPSPNAKPKKKNNE